MTPKEAERMIMADGWQLVRVKGSHHQYAHPTKPGLVTIAFHTRPKDISRKNLRSIMRQAGL